jgi:isocitrate dehydrogenase
MAWSEAAILIVDALEKTMLHKEVTYDLGARWTAQHR